MVNEPKKSNSQHLNTEGATSNKSINHKQTKYILTPYRSPFSTSLIRHTSSPRPLRNNSSLNPLKFNFYANHLRKSTSFSSITSNFSHLKFNNCSPSTPVGKVTIERIKMHLDNQPTSIISLYKPLSPQKIIPTSPKSPLTNRVLFEDYKEESPTSPQIIEEDSIELTNNSTSTSGQKIYFNVTSIQDSLELKNHTLVDERESQKNQTLHMTRQDTNEKDMKLEEADEVDKIIEDAKESRRRVLEDSAKLVKEINLSHQKSLSEFKAMLNESDNLEDKNEHENHTVQEGSNVDSEDASTSYLPLPKNTSHPIVQNEISEGVSQFDELKKKIDILGEHVNKNSLSQTISDLQLEFKQFKRDSKDSNKRSLEAMAHQGQSLQQIQRNNVILEGLIKNKVEELEEINKQLEKRVNQTLKNQTKSKQQLEQQKKEISSIYIEIKNLNQKLQEIIALQSKFLQQNTTKNDTLERKIEDHEKEAVKLKSNVKVAVNQLSNFQKLILKKFGELERLIKPSINEAAKLLKKPQLQDKQVNTEIAINDIKLNQPQKSKNVSIEHISKPKKEEGKIPTILKEETMSNDKTRTQNSLSLKREKKEISQFLKFIKTLEAKHLTKQDYTLGIDLRNKREEYNQKHITLYNLLKELQEELNNNLLSNLSKKEQKAALNYISSKAQVLDSAFLEKNKKLNLAVKEYRDKKEEAIKKQKELSKQFEDLKKLIEDHLENTSKEGKREPSINALEGPKADNNESRNIEDRISNALEAQQETSSEDIEDESPKNLEDFSNLYRIFSAMKLSEPISSNSKKLRSDFDSALEILKSYIKYHKGKNLLSTTETFLNAINGRGAILDKDYFKDLQERLNLGINLQAIDSTEYKKFHTSLDKLQRDIEEARIKDIVEALKNDYVKHFYPERFEGEKNSQAIFLSNNNLRELLLNKEKYNKKFKNRDSAFRVNSDYEIKDGDRLLATEYMQNDGKLVYVLNSKALKPSETYNLLIPLKDKHGNIRIDDEGNTLNQSLEFNYEGKLVGFASNATAEQQKKYSQLHYPWLSLILKDIQLKNIEYSGTNMTINKNEAEVQAETIVDLPPKEGKKENSKTKKLQAEADKLKEALNKNNSTNTQESPTEFKNRVHFSPQPGRAR